MQTATDPTASPGENPSSGATSNAVTPETGTGQPAVVQLNRLSKHFSGVTAVRGVSLSIERGEIFGLLGPNGAGKSTLLKLILGFLSPDSGTIRVFGSGDLTAAHARIGYLPEQPRYHTNFTGREYLIFQSRLAGLSKRDAKTIAARALKMVGIEEAADRRIRTYSKGMRQRLGLAVAVSAGGDTPPELLILDEPASGLAPEGQVAVREVLLDCKRQGSTILLCSHQLTEVERICSRVGILRGGKLVALTPLQDSPRVLIAALPRNGALEMAPQLLQYLEGLHPAVAVKGGRSEDEPLLLSIPTGNTIPNAASLKAAALRALVDGRWDINSVHIEHHDLETIYLQAVRPPSKGGKDAAAATNGHATDLPIPPPSAGQPGEVAPENIAGEVASLPVRPAMTGSSAEVTPETIAEPMLRSGPSTAPLYADAAPHEDSWLNDLRRDGEGQ